jgi:hypothetical protein
MTEDEWLACTDPTPMLEFLRDKASDRKLRLFACACARRVWHLLESNHLRDSIDVLECYAEGAIGADALLEAQFGTHPLRCYRDELFSGAPSEKKWLPTYGMNRVTGAPLGVTDIRDGLEFFALGIAAVEWESLGKKGRLSTDTEECSAQADRMREIFGDPFRPSPPLPAAVLAWNDGTVRRIAQGIYEERRLPEGTLDASRLAVLTDALLDAGCEDKALIEHCREPGPHVRGCWAMDALLGGDEVPPRPAGMDRSAAVG